LYHIHVGKKADGGVDVFEEDWDTLVVLDACRYDMFKSTNKLNGKLSSRVSRGSSTVEWLQANFDGRDLSDTVYVTANPQLERNRHNWNINLHEIINVWLDEGWDDKTGTVLAETMTEAALDAVDKYPHKRLVVHYMQPHYPFVPADTTADKEHLRQINGINDEPSGENVWNQMFIGNLDLTREELWSIYVQNLEYALEHVEEFLSNSTGKAIVTGDHGNYVGERASPIPIREYGHPRGLYDDPIIQVPWFEYQRSGRREIWGEESEAVDKVESETVSDRLKSLGYAE
jgi:hypothetical protein